MRVCLGVWCFKILLLTRVQLELTRWLFMKTESVLCRLAGAHTTMHLTAVHSFSFHLTDSSTDQCL